MADGKPLPDDEDPPGATDELVAYLDGELDPKVAEELATQLNLDPKLRAEAEALQRTWDILDILPRPEPSPSFASRTVSQVIPLPGIANSRTMPLPAAPTMAATAGRSAFWIVSAMLIVAAGFGGYFGHRFAAPHPGPKEVQPPVEDYSLMRNMRLYRYADDIEYVKQLDSPDLFGGEE
jgi:anti-sigma factor RsiW